MREYSFDLEETKQQEMKQLIIHNKEQYASQTLHLLATLFLFSWICVRVLDYTINLHVSSTGNLCPLAEVEFQSGVCCLDSLESAEGVCRISSSVSAD